MHEEEESERERERSIHGYNTNVLAQEFKASTIKRLGEQIILLIISVNKFKGESTIFNQLTNEVMSDLNVFCSRMLSRIFRDVDGIGIVTIYSEMLLKNTIIKKEFLHLKKFGTTTTSSNVFSLSSGERDEVLFLAHPQNKVIN